MPVHRGQETAPTGGTPMPVLYPVGAVS